MNHKELSICSNVFSASIPDCDGEGGSKIILRGHRTWTHSNSAWESYISWHKVFNLNPLVGGGGGVMWPFPFLVVGGGG